MFLHYWGMNSFRPCVLDGDGHAICLFRTAHKMFCYVEVRWDAQPLNHFHTVLPQKLTSGLRCMFWVTVVIPVILKCRKCHELFDEWACPIFEWQLEYHIMISDSKSWLYFKCHKPFHGFLWSAWELHSTCRLHGWEPTKRHGVLGPFELLSQHFCQSLPRHLISSGYAFEVSPGAHLCLEG